MATFVHSVLSAPVCRMLGDGRRLLLALPVTFTISNPETTPTSSEATPTNPEATPPSPGLLLLTPDRLHLLDCASDVLQQSLLISECNLVGRGGAPVDQMELRLVPCSLPAGAASSAQQPPQARPVEHYLQTQGGGEARLHGTEEAGGGVVLLLSVHHAVLLTTAFHGLRQHALDPHTSFSVHGRVAGQMQEQYWRSNSFQSASSTTDFLPP